MTRVSVVIPAYNAEEYIEAAISCVLQQSFQDFEILVVNDGSTDRTRSIVERFRDPRVRLIKQANRGLAGARNSGIREAVGEYVALLDADDLWHRDKLVSHVTHLDENPSIGVSYSASQFMDDDGRLMSLYQSPKLTNISAGDVICRNPIGNGSAPVIRRAVFSDIETQDDRYGDPEPIFFDPDFRQSEDIECWTRIITTTNWQFEGLAQALTLYRLNSGGLSASVYKQLASWEMYFDSATGYAPRAMAKWGNLARAYQYRYLARRAVWSREPDTARELLHKALKSDVRILWHEPVRTVATILGVYLQSILPQSVYRGLERVAILAKNAAASA